MLDWLSLSNEIWVKILEYLKIGDLRCVSLTCKGLHDLAVDVISRKGCVRLDSDEALVLEYFRNSTVQYRNWKLQNVCLSETAIFQSFWDAICLKLKSLTLCDVKSDAIFPKLIAQCQYLEELHLIAGPQMFMTWFINEEDATTKQLKVLSNLKYFSIVGSRYLTDNIFNMLTLSMSNLVSFSLINCAVKYHQQKTSDKKFAGTVLDVETVFSVISRNAKTIEHLDFSKSFIQSKQIVQICQLDELKLKSIALSGCDSVDSIKVVFKLQPSIEALNICGNKYVSSCDFAENGSLKYLDISQCRAITQVDFLSSMPDLERLELSSSYAVPASISNGLLNASRDSLRILSLANTTFPSSMLCELSRMTRNLENLNLENCVDSVNDQSLQAICKSLKKLKVLNLAGCDKLTDFGLCGIKISALQCSKIKKMEPLLIKHQNLVTVIPQLFAVPDQNEVVGNDIECDQMSSLPGLQFLTNLEVLILRGVSQVTDVTLKVAFKFDQLKELDLSGCSMLSATALGQAFTQCRTLEILNLSRCYKIKDSTVLMISEFLKRIKFLHLDHCRLLTDDAIDSLFNSSTLRILTLRNCTSIHPTQLVRLYQRNSFLKSLIHPSGMDHFHYSIENSFDIPTGDLIAEGCIDESELSIKEQAVEKNKFSIRNHLLRWF